ncbi:hypothetical protein N7481_011232 [Penicillium waksmanii]|uniref:uncharacterized protein n=1 Tax=Penicillium waksmanii TaxID=69791 RepID=UPI0025499CB2|nr:uncharacterized protein N7481_011232 [Penicillium waksmanii]KAJ5974022.1 hypothetical protein N7481_011232 [Penicillium waksmanii]
MIEDDLFSPDPIDDQNFQMNFTAVQVQIRELSRAISGCTLSQDPESRLHEIHLNAKKLSEYKDQETRIVGFIGKTGAVNQRGLARSSGSGSACTSVPTEYRYIDEKHPRAYTIEAEFMGENEVNGLLEELLQSIRRAAIPTDRNIVAGESWAEQFSNWPDLTIEFFARPGAETEIEILQGLKALALDRLTFRPGGSSSLQYTVVADDLESCKDTLDSLTDSLEDSNTPALWPFIKLIRLQGIPRAASAEEWAGACGPTSSLLVGLHDMNHARVRATEQYLSRTCDEVFIVTGILRCVSNQSIFKIIEKAGESKRIRVVCTRADEVSPGESARGSGPLVKRMKSMNADINKLESKFRHIGGQTQEAQGQRMADRALLDSLDRIQKLHYECVLYIIQTDIYMPRILIFITRRRALLMNQRNDSTKRYLNKVKDIKIFCVGNELYGNPPHRMSEEYRNLSGVRELRSYCRSVPAEGRMDPALVFIEEQVPALLDSIRQWTLIGRDSVTPARACELRSVLEQAEQILRQLHSASYAAFCLKNYNHQVSSQKPRCWNNELMEQEHGLR